MARDSKLLLVLILFAFSACKTSIKSVSGAYLFFDKNNSERSEAIHLLSDSTFNYQFSTSIVPYPPIKGKWRLVRDTVVLNSENFSVLENDTLRLVNVAYRISGHSIIRKFRYSSGYRKLKKISKKDKQIVFAFEANQH